MVEFLRARGRLSTDPKRGLAQEANDFMIAVPFLDQHELAAFRIGTLNGEDHDTISQLRGHWIFRLLTHADSWASSDSDSPEVR